MEHDSHLAIEWFESNSMKLNQGRCHLLVSGYKHENIWAQIGEVKIWESSKQKLLGVVINRNLNFNEHVSSFCKKAGRKLSILSKLSKKTFTEIVCRNPVWILSISLDVSW